MEFHQLLPQPATLGVEELLSELDSLPPHPHRPHVLVNFIASVDGRGTLQGRSGPLGGEGDRALFHGLRERVDAVMAGTETLRVERYGRILGKAERRQRRVERGLSPEPLACIVTRTGAVPLDIPLFAEPESRVVVFTAVELDLDQTAAHTEVIHIELGDLTLASVLKRLHADYGISSLLCEGGPTLFGSLLREDLVDELFLTLSPKLAGGGAALPITAGPEPAQPSSLAPRWVLEQDGFLFLRYAVG